jgi:phosphatidyl-myo-inositol dimannoside synthase
MSSTIHNTDFFTVAAIASPDAQDENSSCTNELLLFAFEYPPVSGGISRLCAEIGSNLRNDQVRVSVLTQESPVELSTLLPSDIRIDSRRPIREWKAFRWLRNFKQKNETSQLTTICGIWYPEGLIAYLAGVRPFVILAHGAELLPPVSRWRRHLWSALQRRVLESANLVITNSEYTGDLARRVAPKATVRAIPLAVDAERFSPGDREVAKAKLGLSNKTVLCTVARLQQYKGHDVVLRAIASLAPSEREHIVYLIAGRGPYEQELKHLAAELGVAQQIRWLGFVPEIELPEVYRATDLFVLCTREASREQAVEGFGLVFLEAQACGVPVVGTKTGGIPEAIKGGEGGWLIEQDDSRTLAEILSQLVHAPEAFHKAGIQARQCVLRECTWKSYSQRFAAALQNVSGAHD